MIKEDTRKYYTAKAIAETFYCHEDDIDEMNQKAVGKDEMWTISGREVYWNTKTDKIEVHTEYFDEFDENTPTRKYELYYEFKARDCRNYAEFGEIIGLYFKYFQKDYDAYFSVKDW